MKNYLTIDVEDYFQVAAFEAVVTLGEWPDLESRVERNTTIILDLLDKYKVNATCFIVGWVAKRYPEIVKEIVDRGHDIGCFGEIRKRLKKYSKSYPAVPW